MNTEHETVYCFACSSRHPLGVPCPREIGAGDTVAPPSPGTQHTQMTKRQQRPASIHDIRFSFRHPRGRLRR